MKISDNMLKHNLKNVYFLGGTACGGKTTMGKAIAKKYNILHYDDNYHNDSFKEFKSLCKPKHQPHNAKVDEIRANSWEDYFARLANGDDFLNNAILEQLEYVLLELMKLSQNQKVIADLHLPLELAKEITDYNKVAFLITSPDNVVKDYYQRNDHKDIYELIMSLDEPQISLDNLHTYLYNGTNNFSNSVKSSDFFYIIRDENSTVEKTLSLLEKHFELI